jgi:hypothetical protein
MFLSVLDHTTFQSSDMPITISTKDEETLLKIGRPEAVQI